MKNQESESEHRSIPKIHPPTDLRICPECDAKNGHSLTFDIQCLHCATFLKTQASISDMFALLRQWIPGVQGAIWTIICQMLDSGASVDDRDGLTDMTMLHYAVKSGAKGIGNITETCKTVTLLLSKGANPFIRCRWTNMAAIHYSAFFDVSEVLEILIGATKDVDVNSRCFEFDNGTLLHISCKTLSFESVKILLEHAADASMKDSNGLTPIDLLPSYDSFEDDQETQIAISKIKFLIQEFSTSDMVDVEVSRTSKDEERVADALKDLGLKIGDKIFVAGVKSGILRYCGPTLFANGLWAGIELDEAVGKNDGSIDEIQYFKCPPLHGIFSPLCKISKQPLTIQSAYNNNHISHSKVSLIHVTAKVNSGLKPDLHSMNVSPAEVGDKVIVSGKKVGIVKFIGETKFAPGIWYGIDLGKPVGKNNGSVDGYEYFSCLPNHGIFTPASRIQKLDKGMLSKVETPSARKNSKQNSSQNGLGAGTKSNNLSRSKNIGNGAKTSSASPNTEPALAEGMHVFCNGEIGVILYVGSVSFAEGVWLGVELRTPRGKHDGSINGQRYFTCRPGHGLLVRPSKVYVRGINGSKLIAAN